MGFTLCSMGNIMINHKLWVSDFNLRLETAPLFVHIFLVVTIY